MGPEKGTQDIAKRKKKQPLSLTFFWGWGSFGRPSTALSPIFEQLSSLHYVSLRSRPPAEGKAENEDKEALQTTMLPALCFDLPSLWPLGYPLGLSS